jgi:hypothetical protein
MRDRPYSPTKKHLNKMMIYCGISGRPTVLRTWTNSRLVGNRQNRFSTPLDASSAPCSPHIQLLYFYYTLEEPPEMLSDLAA